MSRDPTYLKTPIVKRLQGQTSSGINAARPGEVFSNAAENGRHFVAIFI